MANKKLLLRPEALEELMSRLKAQSEELANNRKEIAAIQALLSKFEKRQTSTKKKRKS